MPRPPRDPEVGTMTTASLRIPQGLRDALDQRAARHAPAVKVADVIRVALTRALDDPGLDTALVELARSRTALPEPQSAAPAP